MNITPEEGVGEKRVGPLGMWTDPGLLREDAFNQSVPPVLGGNPLYSQATSSAEENRCVGLTFGDLSQKLKDAWISLFERNVDFFKRCKVQPSGKGSSLFPLPTVLHPELLGKVSSEDERVTVENICRALNSMAGTEVDAAEFAPSRVQCRSVEHLLHQARIACAWSEKVEEIEWEEFFRVKNVDYKGDEVLVAKTTCWENVSHSFPSEIGRVNLNDVVSQGLVDYVNSFDDFLLPEEDRFYVKPPKVMVPPESWEGMARNLIEKGVCGVIGGRDIFRVQGKKLLNGMFGVSKQEYVGSTEVHRLIMNLIPLNKIVRGVDGDISTLPAWASMTPLFLDDDQQLLVSSEDVRCFFYIFRTPPEWRRFMAFNRPLPKSLWPRHGDDSEYFLCADVLPMGFKNSVSIALAPAQEACWVTHLWSFGRIDLFPRGPPSIGYTWTTSIYWRRWTSGLQTLCRASLVLKRCPLGQSMRSGASLDILKNRW